MFGSRRTRITYPSISYNCTRCKYETKSKKAIGLHLRVSHSKNVKIETPSSHEFCSKFLCHFCKSIFPNKESLEFHRLDCKHV